MKILKAAAIVATMVVGTLGLGVSGTSAVPVNGPASGVELPQTVKQFDVEKSSTGVIKGRVMVAVSERGVAGIDTITADTGMLIRGG